MNNIDIRLKSKFNNAGVNEAKRSVEGLEQTFTKFGQGAGGEVGKLSNIVKDFFTGGIWGIAAGSVGMVFSKIGDLWDMMFEKVREAEEQFEETKKRTAANLSSMADTIQNLKSVVEETAAAEIQAIDETLNRRQKELDITERLTKANIELAKQKRIAAGASAESANADSEKELKTLDAEMRRRRADAQVEAVRDRIKAAENARDAAFAEADRFRTTRANLVEDWQFDDEESQKNARKLRRTVDSRIERAVAQGYKADERRRKEEVALAQALEMRSALEKEIEAEELKAANDKAAHEKELAAKAADERAKAEIKAAQDAARERERLDAELHQKRMADLRAEIAAQKEAANSLRTAAAAAQSEFERAFAMYRDPSRAAAEIGEERDRADDLDRLHKDARRYGGKWRIDELSQLMAAGDTQGAQDRLAQWRRSASFTPEVEAMVRASAAEQTRTTAEDELRKLNDKTGELASKLETLSQTRDAKLDGIERNTNNLAAKVDELLSVKG